MSEQLNGSGDPWMHHMRRGEFEKAWQVSDRVLRERAGKPCWHLPRHFQYVWDGSSLENKRVLIRCYHGLGDTIQFARYASVLKPIAKEVILWAQPPLIPLLHTMGNIDKILPLHDGTPDVDYDVDVESMELPHIFKTTIDTIPSQVPYLHVQPEPFPTSGAEGLKVGLVWRPGNWDHRRSLSFEQLKPLFELESVQFIILQEHAVEAGWQEGYGYYGGDHPLYEYARITRGLDLLITIDSMPAHLAGAMGVATWNLLHANADWRWMSERDDTPWYPTMRLFRQEKQGEWEGVIANVKKELEWLTEKMF